MVLKSKPKASDGRVARAAAADMGVSKAGMDGPAGSEFSEGSGVDGVVWLDEEAAAVRVRRERRERRERRTATRRAGDGFMASGFEDRETDVVFGAGTAVGREGATPLSECC